MPTLPVDFSDRASAATIAIADGQFDPVGANSTDFTRSKRNTSDDWSKGVDLDALNSKYGKSETATDDWSKGIDLKALDSKYGSADNGRPRVVINTPKEKPDDYVIANPDIGKGLLRGAKDVLDTGAHALAKGTSYLADKILPESIAAPIRKSAEDTIRADTVARDKYDAANPPSDGIIPTAADAGRVVGQAVATTPLMPVKAFQAISGAAKAVPYVGKLAGLVANGGVAGGIFGAATDSTNEDGLASNVGTNALYGAAAGPVAAAGMNVAGRVVKGAQDIAQAIKTNNILKNSSIDSNAARNTLARLTDAGYTPAQAHAELQRMGTEATMADLAPSLTAEAGGLAAKGGIPTDTLKTRFGDRAANSNSVAHDIMETKLGAKPDYEVEKAAARLERQQKTHADYEAAKKSNMALDVMPVAQHIHAEMQNAVGSEAARLKDIGSYLFDKAGNIKTDTAPLLKVRQALDHDLKKMVKEGTTQESSTYRAVSKVRDELDKVLKTNPDLAIADAKYAKLRQDFEGLDLGKKSVSNTGNYDNFAREFNNASAEKQEYMRKGLRIQIGDQMEKATRGELSEAQRLFGKSTSNRKIIKLAFGQDGDDVLNALEKEAKFRAVEHSVKSNSLTAERRAVQERPEYGGAKNGSIFGDAVTGAAIDASTGSLGAGTAVMAAKRTGLNLLSKLTDAKVARTVEGTADLLSRQSQYGRDTALDVLNRIRQVGSGNKFKLPVDNSGVTTLLTIPSLKSSKRGLDRFRGISEQ